MDIACILKGLNVPTVDADHAAVGRLAAHYLLSRGCRHFGFFGSGKAVYSQLHEAGLREVIDRAGFEVRVCHVEYLPHAPRRTNWRGVDTQVREWLTALEKPVAVFADHDKAAHDLADICLTFGLRVPDDVAILGVNNEELECQMAFPPLSSIAIPIPKIAFEAARLLDRMMSGKPVDPGPLYVPPIRVVTRQSTNMFTVDEPIVVAALHYIRNHVSERLNVSRIAADLSVHRRMLEEKFRTLLRRSVLDEIHRVRVERAKELLATTDLPVSTVARQSGFLTPERMAKVFGKVAGMTASQYRRQTRVRPHPQGS